MTEEQTPDTPSPVPPKTHKHHWGLVIAVLNISIFLLLLLLIIPGLLYLTTAFPWVAIVGTIVSIFEIVKKQKWAWLALILNGACLFASSGSLMIQLSK